MFEEITEQIEQGVCNDDLVFDKVMVKKNRNRNHIRHSYENNEMKKRSSEKDGLQNHYTKLGKVSENSKQGFNSP